MTADDLRALVQRLRATTPKDSGYSEVANKAAEAIESLLARAEAAEAECARLRQDAERYRWLREPRDIFDGPAAYCAGCLVKLDTLDAAIDRAIAEGKHE